jgi:hypothetical protein
MFALPGGFELRNPSNPLKNLARKFILDAELPQERRFRSGAHAGTSLPGVTVITAVQL